MLVNPHKAARIALNPARGVFIAKAARQRIVAAGVQNHDADASWCDIKRFRYLFDRNQAVIDVGLIRHIGFNRHKIIHATHLNAMPGVEKHHSVRINRLALEIPQREREAVPVRLLQFNNLKAERFQRLGNIRRVIGGIGELGNLLVFRVADDERHALVGKSVHWQESAHQRPCHNDYPVFPTLDHGGHGPFCPLSLNLAPLRLLTLYSKTHRMTIPMLGID